MKLLQKWSKMSQMHKIGKIAYISERTVLNNELIDAFL